MRRFFGIVILVFGIAAVSISAYLNSMFSFETARSNVTRSYSYALSSNDPRISQYFGSSPATLIDLRFIDTSNEPHIIFNPDVWSSVTGAPSLKPGLSIVISVFREGNASYLEQRAAELAETGEIAAISFVRDSEATSSNPILLSIGRAGDEAVLSPTAKLLLLGVTGIFMALAGVYLFFRGRRT